MIAKPLFSTTEAQRAQSETSFLPDRETAIGQKIAALRALSSNRVVLCRGLEIYQRAFAEGGGSFPWPSLPAREKISLLRDLGVSVVSKSICPSLVSAVCEGLGLRIARMIEARIGAAVGECR